jgi:hypothetical protein
MVTSLVGGCGNFIAAVTLIVVGLAVVKKAHATAAYLVAAAGAVLLLSGCCTQLPNTLAQANVTSALIEYYRLFNVIDLVGNLAFYGLVIGGAVVLAKHQIGGAK